MELEIEDIRADWKLATEGLAQWRTEARDSYDFTASHQWEADDLAKLEEQERPAVTFDRIGVFVDAVCGMEINNRQAIKYLPVERGDVHVNDLLTQAVKYFENDCGAEDEDSEAVRDTVVCGVGVTETVLSTERHADGAPCVSRRDPLSVWFDPNADKRNLSDARFVFHGDWVPLEEAQTRWPDGSFSGEAPSDVRGRTDHIADKAFEYREDAQIDQRDGQVFVLHYQCFKREEVFRLREPESGKVIDFSKQKFTAAKRLFKERYGRDPVEATKKDSNGDFVKSTKKAYYRAFVSGSDILEQDKLPTEDFTFKFLTFKRDRNKRMWYGLVRVMKDPQRWANKWLSQILHIVNTNAKGGAFVETGALKDPRSAEELWAQANPLILLKEGGINKIRERTQSQYPNGLDRLMQFAFNALPMVSGINLEVLGLADREQAGVLESQRRQSAFTILAPLFAAIREYRRARGRLMLAFLKFIPQGTLIRIVGKTGEQWVPFVYEDTEYDVKIDQAPDSPDYKKSIWESLQQILPAMMKAGYPIPPEILLNSPLPTDIAEEWVGWIKQQGWMPPAQQQQMQQMQEQLKGLGQENMQLKEQNMGMRLDHTVNMLKIQQRGAADEKKASVKEAAIAAESFNKQLEVMVNAAVKRFEIGVNASVSQIANSIDAHKTLLEHGRKLAETAAKLPPPQDQKPLNINLTTPAAGKRQRISIKKTQDGYDVSPVD